MTTLSLGKSRRWWQERLWDLGIYFVLLVTILLSVLPFISILAKSMSSAAAVRAGNVSLMPVGFTLEAYEIVLGNLRYWRSFLVTVIITVVGTFLNTLLTVHVAYAVSRKKLPGRRVIGFLYIFTMFFNGGLIPSYLVVRAFGLINTIWAVIIPGLVVPYHMIIVRNYFFGIPESLEESAKIDGASNVRILYRIFIPMSLPPIATIALFYSVDYWNQYFEALIYITDSELFPLQVFLREIITLAAPGNTFADVSNTAIESIKGAAVFASTLPIIMVYPFLQRYFVQGIMLGAVKE